MFTCILLRWPEWLTLSKMHMWGINQIIRTQRPHTVLTTAENNQCNSVLGWNLIIFSWLLPKIALPFRKTEKEWKLNRLTPNACATYSNTSVLRPNNRNPKAQSLANYVPLQKLWKAQGFSIASGVQWETLINAIN